LLDRIPRAHWPAFIRGDSDWGSDTIIEAMKKYLKGAVLKPPDLISNVS